jgi:hypothetical protein
MQTQLAEQRAEFRLDQRPILTLIPIPEGGNVPPSGGRLEGATYGYNYGVKNIGKGVALKIRMFEYVSILGSHFSGVGEGKGRYNPDLEFGEWFWSTAIFDSPITQERLDMATNIDSGIIIKVIIKYKDISGTIYETPICTFNHVNGPAGNCLVSQFASIPTNGEQYEKDYK